MYKFQSQIHYELNKRMYEKDKIHKIVEFLQLCDIFKSLAKKSL